MLTQHPSHFIAALLASVLLPGCPLSDSYYIESPSGSGGGTSSGGASVNGSGGVATSVDGGASAEGSGGSAANVDGGTTTTDSGGGAPATTTGGAPATGGRCSFGPFSTPEIITGLGLNGSGLWAPSLSSDGLTLYFGAADSMGGEHIYRAERAAQGSAFLAAERVTELASSGSEGTPCISADNLSIYFYSTRTSGSNNRNLWVATRSSSLGVFGTPTPLTALNTSGIDFEPWISADERLLYYTSPTSSFQTTYDIWVATRSDKSQPFSSPQRVSSLSSGSNDLRASLTSDGLTVYFSSDRPGAMGATDIWFATRLDSSSDFGQPSLVENVNGVANEYDPILSRDDKELFFSSSRSGTNQLYRAVRTCQ